MLWSRSSYCKGKSHKEELSTVFDSTEIKLIKQVRIVDGLRTCPEPIHYAQGKLCRRTADHLKEYLWVLKLDKSLLRSLGF
jgi:hypothetical protein